MKAGRPVPKDVDEYIAGFPPDVQEVLEKIRLTLRKAIPEAEEAIKYLMPTFTLQGNVITFAAFKNHIGIYPRAKGTEELRQALSPYEGAKSSYNFPLDQPIPFDLIGQIAEYRAKEHLERVESKGKKRPD